VQEGGIIPLLPEAGGFLGGDMPIPELDPATGALPAGIHEATWTEVVARFGGNDRRNALLRGMRLALRTLANGGCTRVYLGGSFVTAKARPGDWDGCYEEDGVDFDRLTASLRDADQIAMKRLFDGEVFARYDPLLVGDFLVFFQSDRRDRAVGVVALDPRTTHLMEDER